MKIRKLKKRLTRRINSVWDDLDRLVSVTETMLELADSDDPDWLWVLIFDAQERVCDLELESELERESLNATYETSISIKVEKHNLSGMQWWNKDAVATVKLSTVLTFAFYSYEADDGQVRYDIYNAEGDLMDDNDSKGFKSIKKAKKQLLKSYKESSES